MLGNIGVDEIWPLVIFGAGASHDLIGERDDYRDQFSQSQFRPPLADGIFGNNEFFQ